ncbi:hypothetical protein BDFB_003514 [Asbolus verrucosus]|uniref:Uncharacterized protein n=1 Tax=Asbolus verrucosus TaxID=1661398 RepID=A0A482VGK5_ASBVE|nr:hypothetical protein BDFB_003514 [Asbolus verrucosus]
MTEAIVGAHYTGLYGRGNSAGCEVCACCLAAWLHTALFLKEINAFFIGGKEDRRAQDDAVIGDAALPWKRPHWLQDRPTPSGLVLSEYTWDSICKEVFY